MLTLWASLAAKVASPSHDLPQVPIPVLGSSAEGVQMKNNKGYSIFQRHRAYYVRWSEYRDGVRKQPIHRLAGVDEDYTPEEIDSLAQSHVKKLGKTDTVLANSSLKEFVEKIYFPEIKSTLAKGTVALYRQSWNRLKPYLGTMRLRSITIVDVQKALTAIHAKRGNTIGHHSYMHSKVTCSAIFAMAMRLGHHPGPNPEDGTTVRHYGHNQHRENGAFSIEEIRQFLKLFPAGPVAVAIGINAFLALRKPEAEALLPDDYDRLRRRIRIHRHTKTGNDEWLPVIAPLAELLADGWDQINMRRAEYAIRERIKATSLRWKGWYAFRRGMATNLFRLGYKAEEAALVLRNSPEVVRKHYIRLQQEGVRQDAMNRFEQAYMEQATEPVAQSIGSDVQQLQ
jgi:hypothetical protein